MKLPVLNVLGKEISQVELDPSIFEIKPHSQSMFDKVLSERAEKRQGTKSVKTRSEVRGGGRKPWKQKHTGKARTGSIRNPIWRGGGVAHGPNPNTNYKIKLNKKVIKLALRSGWSLKASENSIVLIDQVQFQSPSTKDFKLMLKNISSDVRKVLFILSLDEANKNTWLSGRNLANVLIVNDKEVLLDDLLNASKIITTPEVIKSIEGGLK